MVKNKGLGRGLDALLGNDEDELIKSNEDIKDYLKVMQNDQSTDS